MQTDPTACHSLIGPFQRTCYIVSAPAANGPEAPELSEPFWRYDNDATGPDVSSHPAPVDAACLWAAIGHLRMLTADAPGAMAAATHAPHGC